jgi:hypothetical protein
MFSLVVRSTFKDHAKDDIAKLQTMRLKLEMAVLLKETAGQMKLLKEEAMACSNNRVTAAELGEFMNKLRKDAKNVSNEELLRFAPLFKVQGDGFVFLICCSIIQNFFFFFFFFFCVCACVSMCCLTFE